jgi:dipeptidyl aminopeptidase/acylaminoacyl peptidase
MSPNLTIGKGFKMPKFSGDGSKIFFKLEKKARSVNYDIHANEIVNVDIWNYKDVYLQAQQLKDISNETYRTYTAVMNVEGNKVIQLDTEDDEWFSVKLSNDGNAKYVLVNSKCNSWDMVWNAEGRSNVYLVSTLDGSRKLVKEHLYGNVEYSSNGKYVIWYDQEKSSYFTYNTENASIKNITEKIHAPFYDEEDDHPGKPSNVWILGWMLNDEAVFVYDRYDIWQLDPNGEKSPQNITKGYGRKNNIIFRYVNVNGYSSIQPNQELLLMGFNIINKNNGFFSIRLKKSDNPKKLAMGRYIYYLPQLSPSSFIPALSSTPIRARDTDAYIVRRMNTTTYPNLYFTKDFKKFSTLTNIHPEKNYNWMTSELVHWRIPNGLKAEGILYKPENFNPKKRYPVIFYFYEKLSDQLNNFLTPTAAGGPIDIPYFVSNEYLVFVPNIYYKIGEPGESVYNSIISAAKYISKMPWVDSTKLGLQGHSFGGYEVNYLITRSKIFTAAMSAAGISDLVSMYGTLRPAVGTSNQYSFEDQQFRIGESLLKNQNLYIKNSPIFRAKNVSVPLLLMHNKNDGAVPWEQAIEFFINLRESNKKVWMLQYINGGHEIGRPADTEDFTVRVAQFFDYYLKDSIMPKWMADAQ